MKKFLLYLLLISASFFMQCATAQNEFTTALRTCSKYSQLGGANYENDYFNILITLEKSKNNCIYKEKISKAGGYQLLTCTFNKDDWGVLADSMDKFTTAYKKEIAANKIYEAKLTNNGEIFEGWLVNPKICKITSSKTK